MKIRLLTAFFAFSVLGAFAQQRAIDDAKDNYSKYDVARGNLLLAKPFLLNAKASIDKAAANAKTATSPAMYATQAMVYASLAAVETDATVAATEYATATDAIKKAQAADTKNENATLILHASRELAQIQLDKGVKAFQSKNYDDAYKALDAGRQIVPEDTLLILYTAISASNAKNYPGAITNYSKLVTTNYSKKSDVYNDLTTIYLFNKDTTNALKTIAEATSKFPNNTELRKREIEVNLQAGQQGDLINKIEAAIKGDPNNKTLYYYEGLTFSQTAESAGTAIKKLQKAAKGTKGAPDPQIAKMQQTRTDSYNKAADQYKKAVALDPNYFEAVLNLGYVTMAPAIDTYNDAQLLPVTATKAYDAAMAKAKAQFELAKPYLLKAVELNPQSSDALTNLKSYYMGTRDDANANATQKKIDALPKN